MHLTERATDRSRYGVSLCTRLQILLLHFGTRLPPLQTR